MSKFSVKFAQQYKDIPTIKKMTKKILERGGDIAFKEMYSAKSKERLKREVLK